MDLRKKKTLDGIRRAFYDLRNQKKLESITVTELCRHAKISKAAFYLHYRDIFDLSEQLQKEVIESIFAKLEDPMEILTSPVHFMNSFVSAVESEADRIYPIFSGAQAVALPISILGHIRTHLETHAPHLSKDPRVQVFLTYHVMGGYYACLETTQQNGYKSVLKILEDIQATPPHIG